MKILKRRTRLLILLTLAVVVAVTVTVGMVIRANTMDTRSPRAERDRAAPGAEIPSGRVDCRKAKCIALTFDGNPGEPTDRLMDLLKEYKAPSTFFLEGRRIHEFPDVVRRIAEEGHEIGDHTWTHAVLTDVSDARIRDELRRTARAIAGITGSEPTLMRPPQGRTDDRVSRISAELGMAQVLWTVTAKDYETDDSALITERVLAGAGRDGIVLLHPLHKGTVPAMPAILKALDEQGYTFVTVSQLLAPGEAEPGTIYK
ncbi:polysaccharide deacetylase family protein [Streptomyces antibioticus]|uniref:Deacetylase n=1 Tax=Streptomyces antibioticus TaxID=1890 RepID=A0AAE7CPW5_STRAT|nr:polysaccharide deacetylase family protein [Streptomyces antibioticus]MCX4740995.1 polysaccharide deacetylase family protein [Streptomyces antibioticus]MCX5173600.1 polysaccharide deacetylase family protein [Streptomyces antibioticus]OOQ48477.1 deacetylase [Streptomyces antibioticus]QIT49295.1 polysaccharide deacetylase family protein [Streptomyces antibioticus]